MRHVKDIRNYTKLDSMHFKVGENIQIERKLDDLEQFLREMYSKVY